MTCDTCYDVAAFITACELALCPTCLDDAMHADRTGPPREPGGTCCNARVQIEQHTRMLDREAAERRFANTEVTPGDTFSLESFVLTNLEGYHEGFAEFFNMVLALIPGEHSYFGSIIDCWRVS